MQFKLLTLVVLISAVFAGRLGRFQDTKTVLAEMDQDKFGATMLSAVQMNVAAEEPVDNVVVLIEEILEQVNQDQQVADEKNRTDQAVCDENINSLTTQVRETKDTIDSTERAITENELILQQAKESLEQADQDYAETIEAIEVGTAKRQEDHERWADEDYENQISIATLEEGVKLINHMIHGVAFAQIKVRYDKVLEKLSDNESKHSSLFKPLISSLTQLATKLNYENVMKILELLNNIRVSIVEEREAAAAEEATAQADWDKLLNHLLSEKARLANKRSALRSQIESLTSLLESLRESLENNRVQLENLEASLVAQIAWCGEQSSTYESQTTERTREIEILEKLLNHIREKFTAVSEYVNSRTGPDF